MANILFRTNNRASRIINFPYDSTNFIIEVREQLKTPGNVYVHQATQYLRISYSFASLSEIHDGLKRLSNIVN